MAGVYDLTLMFEKGDIQTIARGQDYLKEAVGTDEADMRARSPVYNADKIKAAVMLIHGRDDERAPFEHAVRMRAALTKAGKPPVWISEGREGHGIFNEASRAEVYEQMLEFFAKHLGATPPQFDARPGRSRTSTSASLPCDSVSVVVSVIFNASPAASASPFAVISPRARARRVSGPGRP